ncbi:hypothetical protein LINGRAPRIM_LOCUS1429 [Linum grandiflorum]
MRLLFCSSTNSATTNRKFRYATFTVKQIMLQIIWLILATLSLTGCICLTHQTGVCPTGYVVGS